MNGKASFQMLNTGGWLGMDKKYPGAQNARWALRRSLLEEQKSICCYCESRLSHNDFHVEHFRPKGNPLFSDLQLCYNNLYACCRAQASGGEDEYCGHKKCEVFHEKLVSPLEPDCASHFRYDNMGGVHAIDERGEISIHILNLNSKLLRESRKNLIEYFEDLDEEIIQSELNIHLRADANPLGEYYSVIEYLHTNGLL